MMLSSIGLPALNGFIGEFLILQGVFTKSWVWAGFAASGIVLGAAYMLSLYQRTMFGAVTNEKNQALPDLSVREWATFLPLIGLAVWIGLYPAPFLDRINLSVLKVAARVNPAYAADFAAACDTTVTPELRAASAGNQFLAAAPCGPDGQPLTIGGSVVSAIAGAPR
jgi:NADH-quinone oxidoreductase subunit M